MDEYNYLLILYIFIVHFMILTYYQEFLLARQPWFKCEIRTARIEGFGKCQFAFGSRAAMEHYTIVSYSIGNQEYTGKISRSLDDQLNKKIVLAVSGKMAVRYEKCNWHFGQRNCSCIYLYVFLQMIAIIRLMVGCLQHDFSLAKMYLIYILIAVLSYAFLKQMIIIRNLMWKKDTGGMKIYENEYKKGIIAFFSMLTLVYSFFLYAAIIINKDVETAFEEIVLIILFIFIIIHFAETLEEKEDVSPPDSKLVMAEVILVDNAQETKRLICQMRNEQEIIQYQKIQYIDFLEKIGDIVAVRVELEDESKYEVLNKIGD